MSRAFGDEEYKATENRVDGEHEPSGKFTSSDQLPAFGIFPHWSLLL